MNTFISVTNSRFDQFFMGGGQFAIDIFIQIILKRYPKLSIFILKGYLFIFDTGEICSGWLGTPTILTISTAFKNIFSSFAGPVKWQSVQSSKVPDH